jgi:hypothetical protein
MMFSQFSLDGGQTANPNALLEQMALASCLWFDRQDLLPTVFEAMEGGCSLLYWMVSETDFPPVRMIVRQGNNLYIHISGTNTPITGNIGNVMGTVLPSRVGVGTFTNSWFVNMLTRVVPALRAALPADYASCRFHYVGHSQGGGTCMMLGAYWAQELGTLEWDWFGFAAPKAFAGAVLPTALLPRYGFVIQNQNDAVCQLPPNGIASVINLMFPARSVVGAPINWRHYGRVGTLDANANITYVDGANFSQTLTPISLRNLSNVHYVNPYMTQILRYWRSQNG